MSATVRVLLVDDNPTFRRGMAALLAPEPGLEIVGEAGDGLECLRLAPLLKPDVVLLDLRMPSIDGVETTRRLATIRPEACVVALTTFEEDRLLFDVLAAGARSFLLKDASVEVIAHAVREAARGRSTLAPRVTHKLVTEFARLARLAPRPGGDALGLSPRELDTLRLVARGRSNKEIAAELGIAQGTVKNHLTSSFAKLGVGDRTQAALRAREHGLV